MRGFTSLVVVMLAVACGNGDGSPGGSGGAIAGSGGGGGAGGAGGSGGAGGTGGTGGTGGSGACLATKPGCESCTHACNMGDLLAQCFQGVPDLCPGAWTAFKTCACKAGSSATAWDACLKTWDSAAGIEGVVLEDCLRKECKASCFGS